MRILFLTAVVTFLSLGVGCGPTVTVPTASGRPDVTFEGATVKEIKDAIILDVVANRGYSIQKQDPNTLVIGKKDDSMTAAILFGSQYDTTPEKRVHYTFVETGNSVRVFARFSIVTNPGSAFERIREAEPNSKSHLEIHDSLVAIKTSLMASKHGAVKS